MRAKRAFFSLLVLSFFMTIPVFGYVWEGFEKENLWFVSVIKDNAVDSISISTSEKSEGKQSLEAGMEKTDWVIKGYVSKEGSLDLSKVTEIQFDAFSEKSVGLTIGITAGGSWTWFETDNIRLKRGWNKNIKVSLTKNNWKSEASGWEAKVKPENLNDVKKFAFVFNNGEKQKVNIDNIRFIGGKVNNEAYSMPYEPFDRTKLVDDYKLLETMIADGWAKNQSPGVTNTKDNLRFLKFEKVDNVDKAAYKVQMDMDWSDSSRMILLVTNNSKEYVCPALGVQSGNGWTWYESPVYLVKPEAVTEIIFSLNAPYFKSEASGWKYNSYLIEKNNIKAVHILLYGIPGKKASGGVTVKNVQFMKGKPFVPEAK